MELMLGCTVFAEVLLSMLYAHRIGRAPAKESWRKYC